MKFHDAIGAKVNSTICFQFEYKGYTVSCSNNQNKFVSVAIFAPDDEFVVADVNTVEEAINQIDSLWTVI